MRIINTRWSCGCRRCLHAEAGQILLRVRYNTKAYCHVRASGHVTGHDHAQVIVTLGSQGVVSQYLLCMQEMMRRRVLPTDVTERELAEAFNSSPGFAADLVQQCRRFRAVLQAADASMHAAPAGGAEIVRPPACSLCEHIKRSLCSAWLYSCSEFCADRPVGAMGGSSYVEPFCVELASHDVHSYMVCLACCTST